MNRHPRLLVGLSGTQSTSSSGIVLAIAVVLGGVLAASPAVADADPRLIDFQGIRSRLNPNQWPMLGSPDASVVLLELFDYTCGSCQQMGARVGAARQRYGDELAVIVVPVALNGRNYQRSQELAKLAISVFMVDRTKFPEFHEWLLGSRTVPQAHQRAAVLVGAARLQKALGSAQVRRYFELSVTLYGKANRGKLPLLASDRFSTRGAMHANRELFQVIERYHTIQPELDNRLAGN